MALRVRRAILAAATDLAVVALTGASGVGAGAPRAWAPPPAQTPATRLEASWQAAIARAPGLTNAAVSAEAFDVTTGRPLAAIHPDWRLTPASLNKLFASVAALATLGPTFRYTTTVARSGNALYLVGGGDPWLEANGGRTLEAMAASIAKRVKEATRVVGVSTAFGPTLPGVGWPLGDLPFAYAAPVSALTSARDEVHIIVSAGAAVGAPARVAVDPDDPSTPPPALALTDDAVTVPAGAPDTVAVGATAGSERFVVRGDIPLGASPIDDYLTIAHPVEMTAQTFEAILAKDGVRFTAAAATGRLPAHATTLLVHRSKPLQKYLQVQNTFSVNSMAESLFRYLGFVRSGTGTAATARAALEAFLDAHAVATDSVHLDGSGLSPEDEASAADLVSLLDYAAHRSWFPVLEHSLIHVGRTDQCSFLCGLMDGTAADGKVWLKTGNLANQWNYAGYATAENGNLIAFAILIDGLPAGEYLEAAEAPIDAMTVDVASYPSEPVRTPAAAVPDTVPSSLPPALSGMLGPLAPGDVVGGAIVAVGHGKAPARTVWQVDGATRLRLGSLPRLAVALAALSTRATAPRAEVLAAGRRTGTTLVGSLVLDGRWDPVLTDVGLRDLARSVAQSGIRSVAGPVEAVDGPASSWDGTPYPADVPWELVNGPTAPPSSPLGVDQDQVGLTVTPAAGGTGPPTWTTVPSGLPIPATLAGSAGGARALTATRLPGTASFTLAAALGATTPTTVTVSAPDPAAVALTLFVRDLAAAGVHVAASRLIPTAPTGGSVVARTATVPLARVALASLGAPSGDLSLDLYGMLGTGAAGDLRAELGPVDDVADPAGLGEGDYGTAESVASMLAQAYAKGGAQRALIVALGRSWSSGTIEGRTVVGVFSRGGHTYVDCLIENGLGPSASGLMALDATP